MTFKIIIVVVIGLLAIGWFSKVRGQDSGVQMYTDVTTSEFKELMNKENTVIIDVRTTAEAKSGIIEGAQVINFLSLDFNKRVSELPKEKVYLVYCRSGNRSAKACKRMNKLGFESLYNLTGGYISWSKS